VNQILKSVVREICMLRSVGVGAPIWCPFYPAELEIELMATTPALYSTETKYQPRSEFHHVILVAGTAEVKALAGES